MGMRVKIKETGEIKMLSIIDPITKVDWINDFVGNHGAFVNGQFTAQEDGTWVADADTYAWWFKVAAEQEALNERIESLKEAYGYDAVISVINRAADVDLEDQATVINRELDELEKTHKTDVKGSDRCEYCNTENVELREYDLEDGDKAFGCVDEERCRRQMMYNEWGVQEV